jgi:hypothetical protein
MTFKPPNTIAPFMQTSIWFPNDFEEFRVKFIEVFQSLANNINIRDISIYDLNEFISGQQWFSTNPQIKRQTFRKVFNLGAIATGATLTTAHGIGTFTEMTFINGTCITDVVDYRPIPYASATAVNQQIEIKVDAVNIVIINGAASPNITSAIVVLEYLKN